MAIFYPVITNRDYLKDNNGTVHYMWEFLDKDPYGFLSAANKTVNKNIPAEYNGFYDCGAWGYRNQDIPPITAESISLIYNAIARKGDIVTAPDHMIIPGCDKEARQTFNKESAIKFIEIVNKDFVPVATIHGQTMGERKKAAAFLMDIGYEYLAIGGLAAMARQTSKVVSIVQELKKYIGDKKIHAFGVSSPYYSRMWKEIGITSYDGSSFFMKALTKGIYLTKDFAALNLKQSNIESITDCDCKACQFVYSQKGDPRKFGNSLNNLGRAIHNLNMLIRNQCE